LTPLAPSQHPKLLGRQIVRDLKSSPRRKDLEEQFETLLQAMEPTQGLYELAKAMFKDTWEMRLAQAEDMAARAKM
jgi:hypothetical protein